MNTANLPVEEFTTPSPVTATEETSLKELFELMRENEIRHLPILRGKKVVGIISDRDLKVISSLEIDDRSGIFAKDIMVKEPVSVICSQPVSEAAFVMAEKKIGSVMVNDEEEQFLGIFTVTDALNALIESGHSKDDFGGSI